MTSTLSSYEIPAPSYEDLDASLLPPCNRPSYMVPTPQPAYEDLEPVYEDLDALLPAVTDGSQSEVKAKPVPRPRSKVLAKAQSSSNDGPSDSEDKRNSTTNKNDESSPEYKRLHPVRPAPEPPANKYLSSGKTLATENQYTSSQPSVKPPASKQTKDLPPRPERPPLPSIYYGRTASHKGEAGTQTKSKTEECEEAATDSSTSSKPDPVSSTPPEEERKLDGTNAATPPTMGTSSLQVTDRKPAVPPRPRQLGSACESSPTLGRAQTAPAPLPRPPSLVKETDEPLYLEILPSENRTRGSTLRLSPKSHQQSKEDTEEVMALLRWLKKVSRPNFMTPSVYGLSIEEEIRSFEMRAMSVSKALRLFNLLMMKRNDKMRLILTEFTSISDSVDKLQKKNKTMGIAGGTTGAVGGVTAVVGIVLAPVTLGASLIATAVGAGMVASAGGMGAHTVRANKKIVNRMTVEKLVQDYEANVVDLEHCLDFIVSEMNELRRHDIARLQRAGAQLEAVRMAHLSQSVFNNMNSNTGGMSSQKLLLAFSKEMDQYFTEKNSQKLKKLNKSKFSGRVRLLAKNLEDDLDHLNHMWEQFT